ncbi:hypothetical protein BDM02DRAFT_3227585 [Thelephora ganbajun]|uniref:Uncharacterized protein n=1 Tax=Thelephora ganbajun TaxID=370292 RepID=A0ACB6ZJG8_THEGA|nr:hypothetical protein BDM02DRAFT_3227585 [Thelephora ganbajun]
MVAFATELGFLKKDEMSMAMAIKSRVWILGLSFPTCQQSSIRHSSSSNVDFESVSESERDECQRVPTLLRQGRGHLHLWPICWLVTPTKHAAGGIYPTGVDLLPPSNPGFQVSQRSGWGRGEPLGPYFARMQDVAHEEQQPVAGPSNLGKRKVIPDTRTAETEIEGYNDIVEVKKEQVIDLTVFEGEMSRAYTPNPYPCQERCLTPFQDSARKREESASNDHLWTPRSGESTIAKFVGSGPSTPLSRLLRRHDSGRVLTERHGYWIAVIMNEFGDTAIRLP